MNRQHRAGGCQSRHGRGPTDLPSFLASPGVLAAPFALAGAGVATLPPALTAEALEASFLTGTGVAALDFCCLAAGVDDAG
jgi:hypothetical protein